MKKNIVYWIVLPMIILSTGTVCSCGDDEAAQAALEQENAPIVVMVDADGKADGGHSFTKIDDEHFYIDNILYTAKNDTLSVTGFDKEHFDGIVNIISQLNYDGRTMPVTSIGNRAFLNSRESETNSFVDLSRSYNKITSLTIPESVTSIGESAFSCCQGLKSVIIPPGVKVIPNLAFFGCEDLTTIRLPEGLTEIGDAAFFECKALTSIQIPDNVKKIGDGAFRRCTSITSIHIPKAVENIEPRSFMECPVLTTIIVDKDNKTYDSRENCNAIVETDKNKIVFAIPTSKIPFSITAIGDYAFFGPEDCTSVTIPSNVEEIGLYAFAMYLNLEDVYCYAEEPPHCIGGSPFDFHTYERATLHVPASAVNSYTYDYWCYFKKIVAIE